MPPVRQKPEGWYSTQQPQRTSYTARKTSTTETMPKQIPNEIVYAREFLLKRLQPTKRSSQRYFKKDDLDRFGVSVQELDFDTRRLANNRHPPLLKLPPSDIIKTAIYSIEPWKYDGADEPEDLPRRYHQGEVQPTNYYTATYSDDPVEFYHESVMLPGFINCYLLYPRSKTDPDCVQRISRWDQCLTDNGLGKSLRGYEKGDYMWCLQRLYRPFVPNTASVVDSTQPHAVSLG